MLTLYYMCIRLILATSTHRKNDITGKTLVGGPPMSNVVLVYFLGGCTYSEITALRFLGKVKGILTNIHSVNSIVLYSHTRDFCLAPAF